MQFFGIKVMEVVFVPFDIAPYCSWGRKGFAVANLELNTILF